MQRIMNLTKWQEVREGSRMNFTGSRPRTVRIEVNTPVEVALYIIPQDEYGQELEPLFLALVKGRDVIEFSPDGAFALAPEGGTVYVNTADGDVVHVEVIEPKIFTKIAERKRRDPVLEQMMYEAQRNLERRLAAQADQFSAMLDARDRNAAAAAAAAAAASAKPKQSASGDGGSQPPVETPPAAGGAANAE